MGYSPVTVLVIVQTQYFNFIFVASRNARTKKPRYSVTLLSQTYTLIHDEIILCFILYYFV